MIPGDHNGDGGTDFAVWCPSEGNWYVIDSSTGKPRAAAQQWGAQGDIPVFSANTTLPPLGLIVGGDF